MGDLLNIFSGPAQVSLYDSTNKELLLGYLGEDIEIEAEDIVTGISDGNKCTTGKMIKFACPVLQTDDGTLLSSLKTRRSYLQTIYIVGSGLLVKISDVLISLAMNRQFKSGEIHKFALTAETKVSANFESIVNLLGSDGNCNTEVGSTGLATGWASDAAAYDVDTSSQVGRGNEQRVTFDDVDQSLYYDIICPLEFPVKVTVSASVKDRGGGAPDFMMGIKTKTNADVVVDSEMTSKSLTAGQNTRLSQEINLSPGANVCKISVYFEDDAGGGADLGIDDVQLEFGELTDFTDNSTE